MYHLVYTCVCVCVERERGVLFEQPFGVTTYVTTFIYKEKNRRNDILTTTF
jgi:hypothetical protein